MLYDECDNHVYLKCTNKIRFLENEFKTSAYNKMLQNINTFTFSLGNGKISYTHTYIDVCLSDCMHLLVFHIF